MTDTLRFFAPPQVDLASGTLFRSSGTSVGIVAAGLGLIVAGCLWVGWHGGVIFGGQGAIPAVLLWWIILWLALFFLVYANDWRKTLEPTAWLALAGDEGIYIKYRSYRNLSWGSSDEQIVFVRYAVIAAARVNKRSWLTPEPRSTTARTENLTYIELELVDVDLSVLEQRLADERAGKPGRTPRGVKIWRHFPVSVEPGNVLRIEWRARPNSASFARCLAAHGIKIAAPVATVADLRSLPSDEQLRELARRGQVIDLIRVLRHDHTMPLAQAKEQANKLIAEAASGARSAAPH